MPTRTILAALQVQQESLVAAMSVLSPHFELLDAETESEMEFECQDVSNGNPNTGVVTYLGGEQAGRN